MTDKKQRPSKEERRRADRAISQDELATRERDFVMRLMTGENVLDDIEVPKWKLTTLAEAEKILIHLAGEIKDLERAVDRLKTNVRWGFGLVACILILILYWLLKSAGYAARSPQSRAPHSPTKPCSSNLSAPRVENAYETKDCDPRLGLTPLG